jgi:hypothetical protein
VNRTLSAQPPEQLQRRPLLEVCSVSDAQLLEWRLILACSAHDLPFPQSRCGVLQQSVLHITPPVAL